MAAANELRDRDSEQRARAPFAMAAANELRDRDSERRVRAPFAMAAANELRDRVSERRVRAPFAMAAANELRDRDSERRVRAPFAMAAANELRDRVSERRVRAPFAMCGCPSKANSYRSLVLARPWEAWPATFARCSPPSPAFGHPSEVCGFAELTHLGTKLTRAIVPFPARITRPAAERTRLSSRMAKVLFATTKLVARGAMRPPRRVALLHPAPEPAPPSPA